MSDPRADRCYEAEYASGLHFLAGISTVPDAQAFVDHMTKQPWWRRMGGPKRMFVKYDPKDGETGCALVNGEFIILLTLGHLSLGWVVHESSHAPSWETNPNDHGSAFIKAERRIVKHTQVDYIYRRLVEEQNKRELYP